MTYLQGLVYRRSGIVLEDGKDYLVDSRLSPVARCEGVESVDELVDKLRREYAEEIDILHLASELVVDAVIQPEDLRAEVARRFALSAQKARDWPAKRNPVTPV
jgi:acetyl-CoA carboxylase carboxyltransferase component